MDKDALDYFAFRERQEREAARTAACDAARRVHEDLARGYAVLVRRGRHIETY